MRVLDSPRLNRLGPWSTRSNSALNGITKFLHRLFLRKGEESVILLFIGGDNGLYKDNKYGVNRVVIAHIYGYPHQHGSPEETFMPNDHLNKERLSIKVNLPMMDISAMQYCG